MAYEALLPASRRLSVPMEALAALGAERRIRHEGTSDDPRVHALVQEIVRGGRAHGFAGV